MKDLLLLLCLAFPLAADVNSTVYLPQVVDGGGWQTTFTVVNLAPLSEGQAILHIWSEEGNAMALPFAGITGARTQVDVTVPGGGVFILRTAGTAANLAVGWADLDVQSSGHLAITAIMRYRSPSGAESEVVVPSRLISIKSQVFVFDHQASDTGLAMINASRVSDVYLNVTVRSEAGKVTENSVLKIPAGNHGSFVLHEFYPVTATVRGTIEFAPQPGGWFGVMGLRFSRAGAITSLEPLTP